MRGHRYLVAGSIRVLSSFQSSVPALAFSRRIRSGFAAVNLGGVVLSRLGVLPPNKVKPAAPVPAASDFRNSRRLATSILLGFMSATAENEPHWLALALTAISILWKRP